jgi:hypothetical protein
MNYYVDIIDTENNDYTTRVEMAAASSVVLSYKGSDQKDNLKIVGSSLKFTILVPGVENVDGALDHLFTGDEIRYRVEIRKEADDKLIWQGFNLPDTYSEPYKAGTLSIDLKATDGLGRLKGKYLPDEFYQEEKTVIEILQACLALTGLEMPVYFCPAIENFHQKKFHTIYIDGKDFTGSNDKKDDAYKILEYFAQDLLFCVFQSMGYWHLEGLNKRNLVTYTADEYAVDGNYNGRVTLTRNIKTLKGQALATPVVTTVPPYGRIRVEHEREPVAFLETQSKEVNDGWAVTTGVNPEIYASEWQGSFYAKSVAPDYDIIFYNSETGVFNQSVYTGLRSKLYLQKGEKYKLTMSVRLNDTLFNQNTQDPLFKIVEWEDPINYKVVFNDEVLFANYQVDPSDVITDAEKLKMETNQKVDTVTFEFVVQENGLLDVVFFQPYKDGLRFESVSVTELKLEAIGFEDLAVFEDVISEEFTQNKEVELTFSDDPSGYSKSFRLEKLSGNAAQSEQIQIPILYSFSQFGNHFAAVQLDGANLISEDPSAAIYVNDPNNVKVLDVIYNYQEGEQMLLLVDTPGLSGNFVLNRFFRNQGPADRDTWKEWGDSIYQVEKLPFAEAYAKIYRRLFKIPHVKADLTLRFPVLFNDLLRWDYKQDAIYAVTNLRAWDIDAGKTSLTMVRAIYQEGDDGSGGDNLPPFVDAGPDLNLDNDQTSIVLNAIATDPDGFITGGLWQQVAGDPGGSINGQTNIEEATAVGLTGDFYTFRITVTDNDGATAFDEVNVTRLRDYLITLTEILNTSTPVEEGFEVEKHFRIDCTPALPDNFNLNIGASYEVDLRVTDTIDDISEGQVIVYKNGVEIVNDFYQMRDYNDDNFNTVVNIPFNYNNTDTIIIKLKAVATFTAPEGVYARSIVDLNVNTIEFSSGAGVITSVLPLNQEARAETV